ncbi:phosphopantetheine-binding protein [uncultured Bacteroides sp.]|uniref:phosphopantetheine-binding protein n=1 Tax=uncultured Bacteroides sp. TaxID=162156 RepID=UPI002AAA7934|nr:phosphopantetheine-binding protein [uncultured Bacteroides sp.]
MTDQEIIEKIRVTLAEEFEVDIDVIQSEAPLMQTLELDSLDLVDMVVLVEQNFGFNMTGQDFVGIKTFQDFYDLVITRMQEAK